MKKREPVLEVMRAGAQTVLWDLGAGRATGMLLGILLLLGACSGAWATTYICAYTITFHFLRNNPSGKCGY